MDKITNEDIKVYGRLVNVTTEGVLADANQIWDENQKANQETLNAEFKGYLQRIENMKNRVDALFLGDVTIKGNLTVNGKLDAQHATTSQYGLTRLATSLDDADKDNVVTVGVIEPLKNRAINNTSAINTINTRVNSLEQRVSRLEECCDQVKAKLEELGINFKVVNNISNTSCDRQNVIKPNSYTIHVTPDTGYKIDTITVTNNGVAVPANKITGAPKTGYAIVIDEVAGDIIINGTSSQIRTIPVVVEGNATANKSGIESGVVTDIKITPNDGYTISNIQVTSANVTATVSGDTVQVTDYTQDATECRIVVTTTAIQEDDDTFSVIPVMYTVGKSYYGSDKTKTYRITSKGTWTIELI